MAQRIYNKQNEIEDESTVQETENDDEENENDDIHISKSSKLWSRLRFMVLSGFISRNNELVKNKNKQLEMNKWMNIFFINWRSLNSFKRIPTLSKKDIIIESKEVNDNPTATVQDMKEGLSRRKVNNQSENVSSSKNILLLNNGGSEINNKSQIEPEYHEIVIYNGFILMNISCESSTRQSYEESSYLQNENKMSSSDELGCCIMETVLGRLASDVAITASTKMKFKDDMMKTELVRYFMCFLTILVLLFSTDCCKIVSFNYQQQNFKKIKLTYMLIFKTHPLTVSCNI